LRPFYRWGIARIEPTDPWAPSTSWIPLAALGSGATRRFDWYLEGETTVKPCTVDEICAWLFDCQYASDHDLFHERDFWQHPKTFEQLRKGDCEDFAIWAWRSLLALGLDARLFIGLALTRSRGHFTLWGRRSPDAERSPQEATGLPAGVSPAAD